MCAVDLHRNKHVCLTGACVLTSVIFVYDVQGWAKEWSLGCVNLHPTARGSQEAGFKQPRDHSVAEPCTVGHVLFRIT